MCWGAGGLTGVFLVFPLESCFISGLTMERTGPRCAGGGGRDVDSNSCQLSSAAQSQTASGQ